MPNERDTIPVFQLYLKKFKIIANGNAKNVPPTFAAPLSSRIGHFFSISHDSFLKKSDNTVTV